MRKIIVAVAILACSLAGVAAPPVFDMGNGNVYYVLPKSGRFYAVNGTPQWDAVIVYGTDKGDTIPVRVAATGCNKTDTMRLTARVNDDGSPATTPKAWSREGGTLLDEWAMMVCVQAVMDANAAAKK